MAALHIPDSWTVKKLKDTGEAIIGLTYSPKDVVSSGGIEVLRSSNVQHGRIVLDDLVRVNAKIPEKIILQDGDILVCARNGSRRLIGKNARINGHNVGKTFGAFMCVYRSHNPNYMYWIFQTESFRKQIARDLGPTINQVTTGNLNSFKFAFPEKVEQQRIMVVLEAWNNYLENLDRIILLKKNVRQGLMQKLLTGKVRLPSFSGVWKSYNFNDIFESLKKPKGIKSDEYKKNGIIPIFDQSKDKHESGYTDDVTYAYDFSDKPVTLFGDHSRVIKYICGKVAFGNDGIKLLKTLEGFDPLFGHYLLSTYPVPETGYNRHFKYLVDAEFEIPSLVEQKAIATTLELMDSNIKLLEDKRKCIYEQRKYLVNNLVMGKLRTPKVLSSATMEIHNA